MLSSKKTVKAPFFFIHLRGSASGTSGGSITLEGGGYYGAKQQMEKNKKDGMGAR